MATKILAGNISGPIRTIAPPEVIQLRHDPNRHECWLDVVEYGDPRSLVISQQVYEVLAAHGFSRGT